MELSVWLPNELLLRYFSKRNIQTSKQKTSVHTELRRITRIYKLVYVRKIDRFGRSGLSIHYNGTKHTITFYVNYPGVETDITEEKIKFVYDLTFIPIHYLVKCFNYYVKYKKSDLHINADRYSTQPKIMSY
ncbi:hypothetical protein GCM10028807_28800 [Spirosoma daeguense]